MKSNFQVFVLAVLVGAWMAAPDALADSSGSRAACERYANKSNKRFSPRFEKIDLHERELLVEKFEDKVGKQFVSTILSGVGVYHPREGREQEILFTCLLENAHKPVLFHMIKHPFPNSLKLAPSP